MRKRVAILISGSGSNMQALIEDMRSDDHGGEPVLVLSNRPDAGGLDKARALGVPAEVVDRRAFKGDRAAFDAAMQEVLGRVSPDLLCLAGFMRILTPAFVESWSGRILNIHPSILPLFPGLDTHQRCLDAGMAMHGCTVHEVTPELDSGPILGQAAIAVRPGDTASSIAARLLPMEHRLYRAVLRRFVQGDRKPVTLFDDSSADEFKA